MADHLMNYSVRGCEIECFVTEVRISRLWLTTQANGEKSLRTHFLLKLPIQRGHELLWTQLNFHSSIKQNKGTNWKEV